VKLYFDVLQHLLVLAGMMIDLLNFDETPMRTLLQLEISEVDFDDENSH